MPASETLERFIARVEANAHVTAIEEFYTAQASMQENEGTPRVGRETLVANERKILARARGVASQCIRPVLVCGDLVVIRWKFHFDWLDGTVSDMEEIAYQRWEGERIAEEKFFYDPVQRAHKTPPSGPPGAS